MVDQTEARVLVKAMHASDYAAVIEILAESDLITDDLTPEDINRFYGVIRGSSLVAIGGVQVFEDAGLLRSLATRAGYANRGYAATIVHELEVFARKHGVQNLFLLTDTAAGYFTRLGYEAVPRSSAPSAIAASPQFTELCPDSAGFMAKSLDR